MFIPGLTLKKDMIEEKLEAFQKVTIQGSSPVKKKKKKKVASNFRFIFNNDFNDFSSFRLAY